MRGEWFESGSRVVRNWYESGTGVVGEDGRRVPEECESRGRVLGEWSENERRVVRE